MLLNTVRTVVDNDARWFTMPVAEGQSGAPTRIVPTTQWPTMSTPLGKDVFGVAADYDCVAVNKLKPKQVSATSRVRWSLQCPAGL